MDGRQPVRRYLWFFAQMRTETRRSYLGGVAREAATVCSFVERNGVIKKIIGIKWRYIWAKGCAPKIKHAMVVSDGVAFFKHFVFLAAVTGRTISLDNSAIA